MQGASHLPGIICQGLRGIHHGREKTHGDAFLQIMETSFIPTTFVNSFVLCAMCSYSHLAAPQNLFLKTQSIVVHMFRDKGKAAYSTSPSRQTRKILQDSQLLSFQITLWEKTSRLALLESLAVSSPKLQSWPWSVE